VGPRLCFLRKVTQRHLGVGQGPVLEWATLGRRVIKIAKVGPRDLKRGLSGGLALGN
jgi:hypothetical protein